MWGSDAALWPITSHCAFVEGWTARQSWCERVTLEYFDGVLEVLQQKEHAHLRHPMDGARTVSTGLP